MGKDDDLLEDQTDGEDNIFDLSLDDLLPEDIDHASANGGADSEIIELMELVEKGKKDLEESDEEITLSYEDNRPTKDLRGASHTENALSDDREESGEEISLSETDLALANISLESDISLLERDEPDMGARRGNFAEDEIDKMLETEQALNMTIQSPIESPEAFEPAGETTLEKTEALIEAEHPDKNEGKKIFRQQDIVRERKGDLTQPLIEEMAAISEEKIEAIVKRVVEDVVERVARETMAEVAERVIREAIDALKQSLEKDSE
jgi:hypothetical protein